MPSLMIWTLRWLCDSCATAAQDDMFEPLENLNAPERVPGLREMTTDNRGITPPGRDSFREPTQFELVLVMYTAEELQHAFACWSCITSFQGKKLLAPFRSGGTWEELVGAVFKTRCRRALRLLVATGRALGIRRVLTPRTLQGKSRQSYMNDLLWLQERTLPEGMAERLRFERTQSAEAWSKSLSTLSSRAQQELCRAARDAMGPKVNERGYLAHATEDNVCSAPHPELSQLFKTSCSCLKKPEPSA